MFPAWVPYQLVRLHKYLGTGGAPGLVVLREDPLYRDHENELAPDT